MKRLEIIANRSVEEDLYELFRRQGVGSAYTLVPVVHGVGGAGPRKGDHVWPEENFLMVVYCEEAEAAGIRDCIRMLKDLFPQEGIKLFEVG